MCIYMHAYVCECGGTGREVRGQSRMWLSSFVGNRVSVLFATAYTRLAMP